MGGGISIGPSLTLAEVVSTVASVADVSSRVTAVESKVPYSSIGNLAHSVGIGIGIRVSITLAEVVAGVGAASGVGIVLGKAVLQE